MSDAPHDAPLSAPQPAGEAIDFDALRKVRGPDGRFLPGVPGPRLVTGERSQTLLDVPELAEAHAEKVAAIETDLGADLSAVQRPLVAELARLQLITDSLGADVLARGVLTGKGRTRAAVTVYLAVLDRQQRLAQLLGLERRTKPVDPLEAVRQAVEDANR